MGCSDGIKCCLSPLSVQRESVVAWNHSSEYVRGLPSYEHFQEKMTEALALCLQRCCQHHHRHFIDNFDSVFLCIV